MYVGLHPNSDVDRFCIPRKDERRGFIAIEDCIESTVRGLEPHVHNSKERLVHTAGEII